MNEPAQSLLAAYSPRVAGPTARRRAGYVVIVALCMVASLLIAQANTPSSTSPRPSSPPTVRLSAYFQGQPQEQSAFDPQITPIDSPTPFPLLITNVEGRFFSFPNGGTPVGTFIATTATPPVFTQQFPVIAFNPPADAHVGCTTTPIIDERATPFTDVIPGIPCGLQPAQAIVTTTPGTTTVVQARVGALEYFQAEFTGNIAVPAAGHVTLHIYSDDGWILGIGSNLTQPTVTALPTLVACPDCYPALPPDTQVPGTPPPTWPITPFRNYPVIGRFDAISGPDVRLVEVAFPAAGTYPFELDYFQGAPTQATLLFGSSAGNPIPPGPTDTPTRTPTYTATPTPTFTCIPGPQWCVGSSQNKPGDNVLNGVVAITQNDVWAVGEQSDPQGTVSHSLVEYWDGQHWNIDTTNPDIGALNAVAALSASDIWAASDSGLIHHDRSAWSTPNPNVPGAKALAASAGAGVYAAGGNVLQRYSNGSWTTVTPIPTTVMLNGVALAWGGSTVPSPGYHIWAVGSDGDAPYAIHLLNGTVATPAVPTPAGATSTVLNSIDILTENPTGTSLWAVGYYVDGHSHAHALTEYWGSDLAWRIVPNPIESAADDSVLTKVWVTPTGDVWAVGWYELYQQVPITRVTLIMHWNGQQWDVSSSPSLGLDNELQAVTSNNPAMSDWAVGDYSTTTNRQTLVEDIIPPTPPLMTTSYYERQVDKATHTAQGCSAAQTPISGGIVVLDYGQPWQNPNNDYGTLLIYPPAYPFVKISQIESAVKAFADGYATCVPSYANQSVTIAVSVNNGFSSYLNSDHGVEWAAMIKRLQATFTPVPRIAFSGGIDAEPGPGFDPTYTATEDWAQGFLSAKVAPYYNFGSPDSYPYRPTPGASTPTPVVPEPWTVHDPWNTDQYYQISYGLKPMWIYALPETYTSFKTGYWYTIARYGVDRYQEKMNFAGQMGSANVPLTPAQGWPILWLALAGDSATYQESLFMSTLMTNSGP